MQGLHPSCTSSPMDPEVHSSPARAISPCLGDALGCCSAQAALWLSYSLAGVLGWVPGSDTPPCQLPGGPLLTPQLLGSSQLFLHPLSRWVHVRWSNLNLGVVTLSLVVYIQHSHLRLFWLSKVLQNNAERNFHPFECQNVAVLGIRYHFFFPECTLFTSRSIMAHTKIHWFIFLTCIQLMDEVI